MKEHIIKPDEVEDVLTDLECAGVYHALLCTDKKCTWYTEEELESSVCWKADHHKRCLAIITDKCKFLGCTSQDLMTYLKFAQHIIADIAKYTWRDAYIFNQVWLATKDNLTTKSEEQEISHPSGILGDMPTALDGDTKCPEC